MTNNFPEDHTFPEWIPHPFLADMSDADNLKEELIDLQVNQGCQTKFRTLPLSGFWCDQLVAYPGLARAALEMIIPFPTTYLCEKAFSAMLHIKTIAQNRLQGGLLHDIIRQWVRRTLMTSYGLELTDKGEVSVWAVVVSLFIGGAIIGASVGGRLSDTLGRRTAMLANHLLCIVSGLLFMSCKVIGSVEMLFIGRFTAGLYAGLATCIVPMYLSEVAPAELKGVMGVVFPLGMCVGLLISQILGLDCILGTESGWPFLLGAFVVLVVMAVLAHPALPESPTYCYTVAQDGARGLRELQRLRGSDSKAVEAEASALTDLASQVEKGQSRNTWSVLSLLRSSTFRMSLIITIFANAAQQLSGVNAVFYYSTLIFRGAGLDLHQSQGASIGAGAINALIAIVAIPLVRHCRRRMLLLTSMLLCVLSQCVLVGALWYLPVYTWASYIAICSLMSYVVAYGIGLGPIPFMLATELFPVGPRSVGIAAGGTANWVGNMVVGLIFPLVQSEIGEFSFILFITSSCIFGIFMYIFLPETFRRGPHTDSQEDMDSESSNRTNVDPESESIAAV
ncbi:Solute carrier family 2, facilitated glucose transporter member 3 [Chionoecetes opilio]|uniref:Solute carrier family 2, facilitated glucose transporter member 3 n=1 Tax=Chionoecetes opilio TaxID=41210 RepID=A0A8J4XWU8_CHIOP|nr:Solute carrier family 2, facilitated glucose transporter member 3 [Chionoecetes opilio]